MSSLKLLIREIDKGFTVEYYSDKYFTDLRGEFYCKDYKTVVNRTNTLLKKFKKETNE